MRGIETTPVPVGIAIEVPSAAFTASQLAREVDFSPSAPAICSCTLAVDRTDDRVSNRYEPLHPAVLRLRMRAPRRDAQRHSRVALRRDGTIDPLLRLLIGCGLTEFSMTPGALQMARTVVAGTYMPARWRGSPRAC